MIHSFGALPVYNIMFVPDWWLQYACAVDVSAPAGDQGRELEKIFAIDRAESDSRHRGGHRVTRWHCENVWCDVNMQTVLLVQNITRAVLYLASEIREKFQSLLLWKLLACLCNILLLIAFIRLSPPFYRDFFKDFGFSLTTNDSKLRLFSFMQAYGTCRYYWWYQCFCPLSLRLSKMNLWKPFKLFMFTKCLVCPCYTWYL